MSSECRLTIHILNRLELVGRRQIDAMNFANVFVARKSVNGRQYIDGIGGIMTNDSPTNHLFVIRLQKFYGSDMRADSIENRDMSG